MTLINGNCLEVMKDISDNSIDLLFCDLPYGQTSCKWDCLIDLELFWKQVNRICKDDTAMFFTCSTKFGVTLINSNPKNFRYDLVWVKSSPCGFLNAKKMPMKKHEMVYVFYKKLPKIYTDNIAEHHTHKFIKSAPMGNKPDLYGRLWNKDGEPYTKTKIQNKYDPPLPTSVIKDEAKGNNIYNKFSYYNNGEKGYDPPLPTSVIRNDEGCNSMYGKETGKIFIYDEKGKLRNSEPRYEPPLPTSIIKEENVVIKDEIYGDEYLDKKVDYPNRNGKPRYEPPLPTSVIRNTADYKNESEMYGNIVRTDCMRKNNESMYEPPLPNTILEIASQKGKHATQKPVDLIKWCLKYYSKEGDTILDPTMGSGSTGVACNEMNRKFIGIEMDETIFKVAEERVNV